MKKNSQKTHFRKQALRILVLSSLTALAACSSDNDDDAISVADDEAMPIVGDQAMPTVDDDETPIVDTDSMLDGALAFTATRSSDFASGRIDRLTLTNGINVNGSYPATLSDIRVATDGEAIYQIGRFGIDSLTRFDSDDTSIVDFQFSVNGEEIAANPYSLAFANDNKAYLTRYGSTQAWIINPAAQSEDQFRIGELDLSAYDDDEPNMSDALIVGDRLFILMERLSMFTPDKTGYVAVFDINDDSEVETGQGTDSLKGIALETVNPTALQYNEQTGEIYVVGRGNFFESDAVTTDFHSGGLETIDPDTFENQLLIDDGTDEENEGGYFVDALVVSPSRGYLITYASFGVSTLRSFNPTTGLLDEAAIGDLSEQDLTTLALAPDNKLWVGVGGSTPGFYIVDPVDNSVSAEQIATELVPLNVVFTTPLNEQ